MVESDMGAEHYGGAVRLILTIVMTLIANAIALVLAAALLDDMTLDAQGFLVAVGIFTLISAIVQPMIRQAAVKRSPAILGSSALLVSLIALIGTAILSDGLQITGLTTWVLAAVAMWAAGLLATALLPILVFKRLRERRD
jgi:uncharacterized membrane protein YvlD (DUF360 family)